MKKVLIWIIALILGITVVGIGWGSIYLLDYALAPDPNRTDKDSCFQQQFRNYPETREWVDSLRAVNALRDTFLVMTSGERHHAYFVSNGSQKTALVVHGWRDSAAKFLWLARIYEKELGYNVVIPDLHASGLSEGEYIRMGWLDRLDLMEWMQAFMTDTMTVHGVSMGAATTMMLSGETMPSAIRSLHFVEDCGYTSVWDEFAMQLKEEFGLPEFPLLYASSLLCKLRFGWSFGEASALEQVKKCHYPMLFIHGSDDSFVPTEMVFRLFEGKPDAKALWVAADAGHARSYLQHKAEYVSRLKEFLQAHRYASGSFIGEKSE